MAYENMIDLSQDMPALKMLYAPLQHHFRVLDVPALPFAILDGKGAPEPVAVGRQSRPCNWLLSLSVERHASAWAVTEGKCVQVMHVGSQADLSALLSQL